MKHIKLFENFLNENELNEAKKISISNFVLTDNKKVYATMNSGIGFSVKINGIQATGWFQPISQYTHRGVDVNELMVGNKRITIASGGGGHKTYAIHIWGLKEKEKQPKDLRFTGPYHETSNLGVEFKKQLTDIVEKHPEWLTDEFKQMFKI